MAVIGFWAAAVLFVADVAVLQEWVAAPAAGAVVAVPDDDPTGPTTITLDSGATVEFPQPPTRSEQVLTVADSEVVLVLHSAQGLDGATYNLGTIEYPEQVNLSDPAANLIASASGAAGNVAGRIFDQEVTVFQGAAAVEFKVEAEDVSLVARHVLHGRRLYAQNVAFRGDQEPPDGAPFFASFTLPPTGPSADPSGTETPDTAADPTESASPDPVFEPSEAPLPGGTESTGSTSAPTPAATPSP